MISILFLLIKRRRFIMGMTVAGIALGIGIAMIAQRTWTVTSSVLPITRKGGGAAMSGIAAQLGVALPTGDATQSPSFYGELARSPDVLLPLASMKFGSPAKALPEWLEITDKDVDVSREKAMLVLRKEILKTDASVRTGMLDLSVTLGDRQLAKDMMDSLLTLIDRQSVVARRSQASSERAYAEERLADAKVRLRNAEDALQEFLLRNREPSMRSPTVQFEKERREREVSMQQQVYSALAQSLEQARLDENRDTPVLTIVAHPRVPAISDGRNVALKSLLGGIAALILAMAIIAAQELWRQSRTDSALQELHAELDNAFRRAA